MLLLLAGLRGKLTNLHLGEILSSAARTLLAAAAAAAAAMATANGVAGSVGDGAVARALPGACAGIVFVSVFFVAAYLFRSPELRVLSEGFLRRFRR